MAPMPASLVGGTLSRASHAAPRQAHLPHRGSTGALSALSLTRTPGALPGEAAARRPLGPSSGGDASTSGRGAAGAASFCTPGRKDPHGRKDTHLALSPLTTGRTPRGSGPAGHLARASTGGFGVQVVAESWEGEGGAQVGGTAAGAPRRPLKINQDLNLWRAREERKRWKRCTRPAERKRHMAASDELYEAVLRVEPTEAKAYVGLGKNYVLQGRVEEARELYDRGTQVTCGENAFLWTSWAYLEASQKDVPRARELYDAAIAAEKSHAAAWHGWAMLEQREGNFVAARDLLIKGIRNSKGKPSSYLYQSVAVLASTMGLIEEARSWFQEGTASAPGMESHAMWQAWAMLEYRQGDYDAARYLFKKCLEVNPKSRYAYLAWAQFEAEAGRMQNARKLLERGIEYNPLDAALLQKAATLEQVEGNFDAARQLFERGSEVDPAHLHIWQAWGVMEYQLGCVERARELFQQGVWAAPGNPDVVKVFQAWGVLEGRQGNYAFARELFKAAIKVDSQSSHTWTAWIALEEQFGALERANELRNLQMQERVRFQVPASFSTRPVGLQPGDALGPVLESVRNFLQQYESPEELESQRAQRTQRTRYVEAGELQRAGRLPRESPDRVALGRDVLDDIAATDDTDIP